jgi:hypothetical protein
MLALSDVRAFLQHLPRDFRLIVDDVTYICNRQNLFAFSTVVRSRITTSPDLSEFTISPGVPHTVVEEVVSFLHGSDLDPPPDSSPFDYFYLAAALGLEIISKRFSNDVHASLTVDNVSECYRRLCPYPSFCFPIIHFLRDHCQIFELFVRDTILTSDFLRPLLSFDVSLFKTEDDKLRFIRQYNEFARPPDLGLYGTVRMERLLKASVVTVLDDEELPCHCRTFPLIASLVGDMKRLRAERSHVCEEIEFLREKRMRLSAREDDITHIRESTSSLTATMEAESLVRCRARRLADDLDLLSASVSLLVVPDPHAVDFTEGRIRLAAMREQLSPIVESFQGNFGWLLYPKSCEKSLNVIRQWDVVVKELAKITENFVLNEKAVFQRATSLAMLAEGLRN